MSFFYTEDAPVISIEGEAPSKTSAEELRKGGAIKTQPEWSGRSRVSIKKHKMMYCDTCQLDHIWRSDLSYSVGIRSVRGVWETFEDDSVFESVIADPLFEDIVSGRGEVLSRCLLIGGNPNAVNDSGDTLLMTAATVGRANLIEELLQHGANVNVRHGNGWTASYLARLQDHQFSAYLLDRAGATCVGPAKGVCNKFPYQNLHPTVTADPVLIPPPGHPQRPKDPPGLQKARILFKPEPGYTEEARKNRITGTVILRVHLLPSGEVTIRRVVVGLPYGLTEKAIEAAKKLRFTPAMIDGRAVEAEMTLEFNFII